MGEAAVELELEQEQQLPEEKVVEDIEILNFLCTGIHDDTWKFGTD